jgi:hypothetical protein
VIDSGILFVWTLAGSWEAGGCLKHEWHLKTCMKHKHQIGVRFFRFVKNEDHIGVRSTWKAWWGHVFTIKCIVWNVQGNSCYLIEMLYWLSPLIDYELECNVKKQIIHNLWSIGRALS